MQMNIQALQSRRDDMAPVFENLLPAIGCLSLRPLKVPGDIPLLHDWFTRDYARFWNMGHLSAAELEAFYHAMMMSGHACAYMGTHDGSPAFLVECYDPRHDRIGGYYEVQPGDRGMHFLVAPTEHPISGFTFAVIRTILAFIFGDPEARRVVVEPDVRNDKIHVLNKRVGFRYERVVTLPEKTANLAFCTREQFAAGILEETGS